MRSSKIILPTTVLTIAVNTAGYVGIGRSRGGYSLMFRTNRRDRVSNPISLISWWKIVDNLRRSLVEPATFLLLVAGWFLPGRPWRWTLATVCILFIPTWVEFGVNLLRALFALDLNVARDALSALYTANVNLLFTLIFLPHQTMLALDAVVRALVRRFVTQDRLLEWETAAESELNTPGAPPWTSISTGCLCLRSY